MKPAITAPQRCQPVGSLKTRAPRIVAKIGTVNCRVVASANGKSDMVMNMQVMLSRPIAVRKTCAGSRPVPSVRRPGPRATVISTTGRAAA